MVCTCEKQENEAFGRVFGREAGSGSVYALRQSHFRIQTLQNEHRGTTARTRPRTTHTKYVCGGWRGCMWAHVDVGECGWARAPSTSIHKHVRVRFHTPRCVKWLVCVDKCAAGASSVPTPLCKTSTKAGKELTKHSTKYTIRRGIGRRTHKVHSLGK